jgi:hypothetical protein
MNVSDIRTVRSTRSGDRFPIAEATDLSDPRVWLPSLNGEFDPGSG